MKFLNRFFSRAGLLFICAVPLLVLKLKFYLTGTPLTGWDTIGHAHLAAIYRTFFADFASVGYDPGWFFGFPAFYFYPPAFYFYVAHLSFLPGVTVQLAFHLGILAVILFFAWNYLRLLLLFFPAALKSDPWLSVACAYSGLLLYLSYSGDGLQGVALVGVLNGTVVATFGHGLVLMAFFHLEQYRRRKSDTIRLIQCVLTLTLLMMTHYLSTAFCYLLLAVYALIHRRELSWSAMLSLFLAPPLLAFPVPYNYFAYGYLLNGSPTIQHYPALLSLMGTDFYNSLISGAPYITTWLSEILFRFKWLNLLLVAGYLLTIRRAVLRKRKESHILFLITASVLLLWLSQDASVSYIFYPIGIHWYRVFDLFYGLFVLIAVLGLSAFLIGLRRRNLWRARILAGAACVLIVTRFLFWDPVAHEKYASIELYGYEPDPTTLEEFLAGIEPGSVILPEKIRDKNLYGSPHSFDYFIQKYGHRNALGLTIESALTPSVTYSWLASGMPQIFQWGIDAAWNRELYQNAAPGEIQAGLPSYLQRAGVNYVLGRTPQAFAYLQNAQTNPTGAAFTLAFASNTRRPDAGIFAFRVNRAKPVFRVNDNRPLGYLSLRRIRSIAAGMTGADSVGARETTRNFLLHANQLRLRPLLREAPPIINLDPHYRGGSAVDMQALTENLSALILMHDGPGLMPSTMSHSLATTTGLPIILVNFQKTAPDAGPARYLYTNLQISANHTPGRTAGFATLLDGEGTRLEPTEFSHNRLALTIPAQPRTRDVARPSVPVEIRLSHFPDWRVARLGNSRTGRQTPNAVSASDSSETPVIYRTDTNHMLVFARAGQQLNLEFHASFAQTITALLYLVSLSLIGCGIYRVYERAREPSQDV